MDIHAENKEITERLEGRIYELETDNEDLRKTVVSLEKEIESLHAARDKTEMMMMMQKSSLTTWSIMEEKIHLELLD